MTVINNGESGLSVRTKLNTALATIDTLDSTMGGVVAAIDANSYVTRDAFIAGTIPVEVTRAAFFVNGNTYAVVRDATGPIVQTNGERWRPDGDWDYKHFGATGDGVTDDAPALQAALTAATGRTITRSAGTYLLNSNVLGDLSQTEIVEPNSVTSGSGAISSVTRETRFNDGSIRRGRSGAINGSMQGAIGIFSQYTNTSTTASYGERLNFFQSGVLALGFSIGHASICGFDGINGGSGLAHWSVAATPSDPTKTFGVFGMEVNPINRASDSGYSKRRGLLSRWTGGIQVVPEASDLVYGTGNTTFNTTFGIAVAPSGGLTAGGDNAKTYNGLLVERNSIAANGRGALFSGSPTTANRPSAAIEIDEHWGFGIDTREGIFNNNRVALFGNSQYLSWNNAAGNSGVRVLTLDSTDDVIVGAGKAGGEIEFWGLGPSGKSFSVLTATTTNAFLQAAGSNSGTPALSAQGSLSDIDLTLTAKGGGRIRFGAFSATADVPVVGHIEIKDAAGNIRKLAVVA